MILWLVILVLNLCVQKWKTFRNWNHIPNSDRNLICSWVNVECPETTENYLYTFIDSKIVNGYSCETNRKLRPICVPFQVELSKTLQTTTKYQEHKQNNLHTQFTNIWTSASNWIYIKMFNGTTPIKISQLTSATVQRTNSVV